MRAFARLAALSTALVACASLAACAAPAEDAARTQTDEIVVDDGARTTSEALVEEARLLAERRLRGEVCEAGATERAIVAKLDEAVKLRDTAFFREEVIGRTATITSALRDSLALHVILGRLVVRGGEARGLAAALGAGVTLHGPAGEGLPHASRLRFEANGEATRTRADRDALGNLRWSSSPAVWSVDGSGRLVVDGEVYAVDADGDDVRLVGATGEAFASVPDEC